jgi:two-component system, OmpR family, response regulator
LGIGVPSEHKSVNTESRANSGRDSSGVHDEDIGGAFYWSAQILYIEDDLTMQQLVGRYLGQQNLRVVSGSGPRDIARQFAANAPDLVILDLRLGQEGLLREIRSHSDVPVIITGRARHEVDRVLSLELGADDYLTKPFGLPELLARIRAILRRYRAQCRIAEGNIKQGRFRFCGWQLDRRVRQLTDPDGKVVALTKGEYALLNAFLDARQRPLSREQLVKETRSHDGSSDRSIDVHIARLRRKLETDPNMRHVIRAERGVGYILDLSVEWL